MIEEVCEYNNQIVEHFDAKSFCTNQFGSDPPVMDCVYGYTAGVKFGEQSNWDHSYLCQTNYQQGTIEFTACVYGSQGAQNEGSQGAQNEGSQEVPSHCNFSKQDEQNACLDGYQNKDTSNFCTDKYSKIGLGPVEIYGIVTACMKGQTGGYTILSFD